jgi:lactam utilization protein B
VRTLCVHGDNRQAVAFVRALRDALTAEGFTIQPFA